MMNVIKNLFIPILVLVLLISFASAEVEFNVISQSTNALSDTLTFNFSVQVNQTDDGNLSFRILIMNRSSRSGGDYFILIDETINNGSFWNKTVPLTRGRTYWFPNVTNMSSGPLIGAGKLVDVDPDVFTYVLGADENTPVINFTLKKGDGIFKGNLTAGDGFYGDGSGLIGLGALSPWNTSGSNVYLNDSTANV